MFDVGYLLERWTLVYAVKLCVSVCLFLIHGNVKFPCTIYLPYARNTRSGKISKGLSQGCPTSSPGGISSPLNDDLQSQISIQKRYKFGPPGLVVDVKGHHMNMGILRTALLYFDSSFKVSRNTNIHGCLLSNTHSIGFGNYSVFKEGHVSCSFCIFHIKF